jgi:hypothetical protein
MMNDALANLCNSKEILRLDQLAHLRGQVLTGQDDGRNAQIAAEQFP